MVTTTRRIEERGQRTPRSLNPYDVEGIRGTAFCECGAVFRSKRWYSGDGGAAAPEARRLVCPACRRTADDNPGGILFMRGDFFSKHEDELRGLVQQIGQSITHKNRLSRIMKITSEAGGIAVATTDAKLAQKLGRELFKSHHGELNFKWNDKEEAVRVYWSR
ncbi:BCAM0308 family protein [Geobacter sp. SVR]|uniref:BCAM0308 family protein n=1 Tax=Geobacter sp. SVR TaxID=2495594 RepID=UPI00143EF755|nr:BCAM0308 family protein [Geobacter sp. SVR]BCS53102.1 hypothetical protein GSVR_14100 [Geobacter sp. SVR]GCF84487.1 hypothetical protein GSbR_10870 [Geobacter sp. SVR]